MPSPSPLYSRSSPAISPDQTKRNAPIIVAACFLTQAVGIGMYVTYGVFFNSLILEFGWSRATISGASSLAFFLMGLFGILVGRLNDRYGPRQLMRITALFFGAGMMLMALVHAQWQLYLFYGVIFGIGLSAIDVIALTTVARWFTHNRGMMTGIVKVGTGAGQFTLPLLASVLISTSGWRHAYIVLGVAAMLILLVIAQVIKRDPGTTFQPENTAPRERPRMPLVRDRESLTAGQALRTVQLATLCLVNLALVFCLLIVLVHIVPHARDIGLSGPQAAGVLSTIGAVSMAGRFTSGMVIDRTGSKVIMVTCFIILLMGLLWLQMAHSLWMLYLFACIYGLAHGGFFTAISPLVAEIFGIDAHGTIFGIIVCFGTTGGAVGPIVAGHLFDQSGSYATTFGLITLISLGNLILMLSLKPIAARRG